MNQEIPVPSAAATSRDPYDMIAWVVWAIVDRDKGAGQRSLFLLDGLDGEVLQSISRTASSSRQVGSYRLAFDPTIEGLDPTKVDADHLYDEAPVRIRNEAFAGPVLIATCERERTQARASLNAVTVLEPETILSETDLWVKAVFSVGVRLFTKEREVYLTAMIEGMIQSGIASDIARFAAVLHAVASENGVPLRSSFLNAVPHLRLPLGSVRKVPAEDAKVSASAFATALMEAKREAGYAPLLFDREGRRFDASSVQAAIDEQRSVLLIDRKGLTDPMLDAVDTLLADAAHIGEAEWRPSQRAFCEGFDWKFAEVVFANQKRRPAPKLPELIKQCLTAEGHEGDLTTLSDEFEAFERGGEGAEAAAGAILEARGEWLADKDAKLAKLLRAAAHPKVIDQRADLSAGLLKAYHTLMANASEDIVEADKENAAWCVVLTAPRTCAISTWNTLDQSVYDAFVLEMAFSSTILDGVVEIDLGKWKDPSARPQKAASSKDARTVALQLEWQSGKNGKAQHTVRLNWVPSTGTVATALPIDIDRLYASFDKTAQVRFWPTATIPTTSGGADTISLHDLGSFQLAGGTNPGITVGPPLDEADFFEAVAIGLRTQTAASAVSNDEVEHAVEAFNAFRSALSAVITMMWRDSSAIFDLNVVDEAATAFGALCFAVEPFARTESSKEAVVIPICEFGLLKSRDGDAAIIPAWHPLRLLERRAKLSAVGETLRAIAQAKGASDGLEREANERAALVEDHRLPEAMAIDGVSFCVVDSLMGYGLAVSESHDAANRTAVEASAALAAKTFLGVIDNYLELNPHEEANLSTAIYGAESVALPRLLTNGIEDRMASNRDLRCEIFITHDKSSELRDIFAAQNAALRERGDGGDSGFLSRLRVGVLPPKGQTRIGDRAAIDVVLLHDAYLRNSNIVWDIANGAAASLSAAVDMHDWIEPRVPVLEDRPGRGKRLRLPLCVSHLPRAIGHYLDLCYLSRPGQSQMPTGKHAIPVRIATWQQDDNSIARIVERSHDLGEWVVSFDRMSTRAMLTDLGIEVIRDIPARGSDHRILVSSRRPSDALRRRITKRFQTFHALPILQAASTAADDTIRIVVRAAGQKLLGASRSTNSANEIIGLATAVRLVERSLAGRPETFTPVWVSIDENQPAFGLKGRIADAVAFIVDMERPRPAITALVVEAKCVVAHAMVEQAKSSREQVANSLITLRNRFLQDGEDILKRASCRDLLGLMSAKPEFQRIVESESGRERLTAALMRGDVDVHICGVSVVAVHDETHQMPTHRGIDFSDEAKAPAMQVLLSQADISDLLTSDVLPFDIAELLSDEPRRSEAPATPAVGPILAPSSSFERSTSLKAEVPATTTPVPEVDQAAPPTDLGRPDPEMLAAFPPLVGQFLADACQRKEALEGQDSIEAEAKETAERLQDALVQHGIEAIFHVEPWTIASNGTLVRFRGHRTLTEKTIKAKLSELQTTHGIDVAYVRPGLGWIGVFVAAKKRRLVPLANLWSEAEWTSTAPHHNTSILVGRREDDGRPLWLNIDSEHDGQPKHGPHTLIAGETGSGKGNLLQSILLQLAATNDPRNLRIKLIDPKHGADFFWLEQTPHLDGEIVTTEEGSVKAFQDLVDEMGRRYTLIVGAKTRDIDGYNEKVPTDQRLPRIVVAHDEMASWMQGSDTYRKSVEAAMTNLASKARAAGIYIILVTQRASQEAIPPSIRENLGNKLCLKVASDKGSVLALGMPGAEALLGRGHLAASLPGDVPSGSPFFIAQVPYISEDDLDQIAQAIRASW